MARPGKLASVTIEQLKAELSRRQNVLPKLLKKKAKLEKLVAALDAQIADLSGDAAPKAGKPTKATKKVGKKKGGRPPREGSLKAVMVVAMSGKKGMTVGEVMEAVQVAGYVSQSKNFRLLVNQTLLSEPEFKKVSRGVYAVKGQPAVAEEPVEKAAKKPAKKKSGKKKAKKAAGKTAKAGSGPRSKPLAVFVAEALAAAPKGLTISAIEKAVLAAGYTTTAKTIYDQVAKILGKGGFTKVSRGVYAVK